MSDRLLVEVDAGVDVGTERMGTCYSTNPDAFAAIMRLYSRPGMTVADVTWGKGVFWRKVNTDLYDLRATDIATDGVDATATSYDDDSLDMVVFDPPYRYSPKTSVSPHGLDRDYRLSTTSPSNMNEVLALYDAGVKEGLRIVKPGGFVVVKCQDSIQASTQHWTHVEVMTSAVEHGGYVKDLLVVTGQVKRTRWKVQKHFDKTHSYFVVIRKGGKELKYQPREVRSTK